VTDEEERSGAYANRRGKLLQVWISDDALARVRAAAATSTHTVAGWVRRVLYDKLGMASRADGGLEPADAACSACLGVGKLRDVNTSEIRACRYCDGTGRLPTETP
jgi:hypothetical protein